MCFIARLAMVLMAFLPVQGKRMQVQVHRQDSSASALVSTQTGRPCALYPALEKKFGTPVKLAGYELEKCLGRGAQGEGWLIKDKPYVLKVMYKGDNGSFEASKKACTFAKHMSKRDPEHFVECLDIGIQEVDMKVSDPLLIDTDSYRTGCNICPGSALNSSAIAGTDENRNNATYTCGEVQEFVQSKFGAELLGGCEGAQRNFSGTCCVANGDHTADADTKLQLYYSVDGLAKGDELRGLVTPSGSELFPNLQDAFEVMLELFDIATTMMTPTVEDPSQFYYIDFHFGNIMVDAGKKITMIDYGATYMCCNHKYPGAIDKCGDLDKCYPSEIKKHEHLTNAFLFFGVVEFLTGRSWETGIFEEAWASDFFDYWTLGWNSMGLMGPPRKNVTDLTPAWKIARTFPPVKESYRAEWQGLGQLAKDMITAGLLQMKSENKLRWAPRWYGLLNLLARKLQ